MVRILIPFDAAPVVAALSMLLMTLVAGAAEPHHGIAMYGEPKYGPGFEHFEYVNPNAPKGGEARLDALGSFDTLNPFTIKGRPATGLGFVFETLATGSDDEPFSYYGLIAETIEVPQDRSYVLFTLRPEARFHDGSPITAEDVIFSFHLLIEKGAPLYRFYYANVAKAEALDERRVKFTFSSGSNRELPLIMGQLPVLSKDYWQDRDFEATTLDVPVGSGPYRIERFETGRHIVYQRDPEYWGKDLPLNRGFYNFDRIRYDYFRDATVALEAFKAGAYDIRRENSAKQWATGYASPALEQGLIKKLEIPHQRPAPMQGFVYNLRRSMFQDARVREALAYAFDFQWSNRNLFYNQYTRTRSYFGNSELEAEGLPDAQELHVLESLREQLPERVFTQAYQPPSSDGSGGLRNNLRQALGLLQEAGWRFQDRKLVDGQGRPFEFEIILAQPTMERVALPFVQNLERLGITATVRVVDTAQYQNRLNDYDFDMIVDRWLQSDSPGNEQREFWGSAAADTPGGRNTPGIKNPAVDQLIESLIAAPTREDLVARVRALDRVLQWNFYVIPHFYLPYDRVAVWDKFGRPAVTPKDGAQLTAWWVEPDKAAALDSRADR